MNRRGFLSSILKAGIACAILPSALTYERRWVRTDSGIYIKNIRFSQLPFYLVKYKIDYPTVGWDQFLNQFNVIEFKENL
jgi:hypothetical protein